MGEDAIDERLFGIGEALVEQLGVPVGVPRRQAVALAETEARLRAGFPRDEIETRPNRPVQDTGHQHIGRQVEDSRLAVGRVDAILVEAVVASGYLDAVGRSVIGQHRVA